MLRTLALLVGLTLAGATLMAAPQRATPAPGAAPSIPSPIAQPPATALILGRVVDAATGGPISDAIVSLGAAEMLMRDLTALGLPQSPPIRRVVTDGEGRFVLRDLPPGPYRFNTSAAGYLSGQYGQQRPQSAAQQFILGPDQKTADVVIRLWKAATISGMVTDEAGEPVVGVRVNLLRRSRTDGKWLTTVRSEERRVGKE